MTRLRLADFETDASEKQDYGDTLKTLQERLERIQAAYIVQGRRGLVALEGWDAAGKGGLIRRMVATLDPRYAHVWPIGAPNDVERRQHYLERFWRRLPDAREIAVFDRSWYGRVLVERIEGFATPSQWQRGYDEINQFEAMQAADGTRIVKIFLHVSQEEQDQRLRERLETPWKRWKTGLDDYRNRSRRAEYVDAYHDMFDRTSTDIAPWTVIAADDKKAARLAGLAAVADGLEAGIELHFPDIDPAVLAAAKAAGVA